MGHYARIKKTKSGFKLLAGKDKSKDQSYFLFELTQKDLEHTLFPIGRYKKEQIRQTAKENHFPNWNKQGTRGICFVGKVNMKNFLNKSIPEKKGKIISPEGKIIGTHPGIMYFTIGQRIGNRLGMEIKKPKSKTNQKWYVADKRKNNILVAAPKNHQIFKKQKVLIKSLHIINPKERIQKHLKARIRHLGKLFNGILEKENNNYIFKFKKPIIGIAEGQSIVLYKNAQIIGGGEIRLK